MIPLLFPVSLPVALMKIGAWWLKFALPVCEMCSIFIWETIGHIQTSDNGTVLLTWYVREKKKNSKYTGTSWITTLLSYPYYYLVVN